MARACSFRAIWVLGDNGSVLISRRFATVERRWRQSCAAWSDEQRLPSAYFALPSDRELARSYLNYTPSIDNCTYDPFGRHILLLQDSQTLSQCRLCLWPVVSVRMSSGIHVLVLPLVQPQQLWTRLNTKQAELGCTGMQNQHGLLTQLESITQGFQMAEAVASLCAGSSGSGGGAGAGGGGGAREGGAERGGALSPADCDSLREFFAGACPFGTPVHDNVQAVLSVRAKGFPAGEGPVKEQQAAWNPEVFAGRPKLLFTTQDRISAALHLPAAPAPLAATLTAQLLCKAELEGLPDVTIPLVAPPASTISSLTVHPCVQAPDVGEGAQTSLCFSPPLGSFTLARFTPSVANMQPPIVGTYTYKQESPTEVSFELHLSYNPELGGTVELCEARMCFPVQGGAVTARTTQSTGTASTLDSAVVWRTGQRFGPRYPEASISGRVCASATAAPEAHTAALPSDSFCSDATGYASLSFKLVGCSISGVKVDPRQVAVFSAAHGAVKAPVEFTSEIVSGEYLIWNSEGHSRSFLQLATSG